MPHRLQNWSQIMMFGVGAYKMEHGTKYHEALEATKYRGALGERKGKWLIDARGGKIYNAYGKEIGCVNNSGSTNVTFKNKSGIQKHVERHRLIFLHVHGYLPDKEHWHIDHRDRNRLNDKIENLRVLTRSENYMNSKARGESGKKGISRSARGWQVYFSGVNGWEKRYFGTYPTLEEAVAARNKLVPEWRWKGLDCE